MLSDFFVFHYSSFIVIISYNKREEDFKSEPDPLRAYNDYLEDVESISKMSEVLLRVNSSNVVEKQLPNGLHAGLDKSCYLHVYLLGKGRGGGGGLIVQSPVL